MSANRRRQLTTAVRLSGVQIHLDTVAGLSALTVLDLSVTSGTLVLVQGDSPAEVRTLLWTLAGRVHRAAGLLEIAGHPLTIGGGDPITDPSTWRRRVGFVGSRPTLFGHLSVAGNIALPVRWSGKRHPRSQVRNLCRSVGLDAAKDRMPAELIPSEQQRVAVAMALAFDPDLLVVVAGNELGSDHLRIGDDELSRALVDLVRLEGRTIVTSLKTPAVEEATAQILTLVDGHVTGAGE